MKKVILFSYVFSLFLIGCDHQEKPQHKISSAKQEVVQQVIADLTREEKQEAAQAVRSLMKSYNKAMDELDAEKMLTHFMDSPDFVYTRNGKRKEYKEFVEGCYGIPKAFEKIECKYDSIYVDVMANDVAIATVSFDETLTRVNKQKLDIEGTMSWVALKRNGKWLFIKGHSFKEF